MVRSGPSYLRVVITARCTLACDYCHREGDPATAQAGGLSTTELCALLDMAVRQGIRKLKFLGGEPLLRPDLPEIIAHLRLQWPLLDSSLITGGAVEVARLDACFDAGLSRANLSIHGWSLHSFSQRTHRGERAHARRQAVLDSLLAHGRFLKLNFVWRSEDDNEDLGELLAWASGQSVVVAVLDDLSNPALGPASVKAAVEHLRGPAAHQAAEPDPHSLPTWHLRWKDGLEVELKDHQLGAVAPWQACASCNQRAACREGILALRLSHDGHLRPCMDRPDLSADLRGALFAATTSITRSPQTAVAELWHTAVRSWLPAASPPSVSWAEHTDKAELR